MRSFFWAWSRFFHSSHGIWQVVIAHFIRRTARSNSPEEIEEHRFQRWMAANHLCMEWRHGLLVTISAWNAAKDCSEQSFHRVQVEMSGNSFSMVCWLVQDAQKCRIFRFWVHLWMERRSKCQGIIFIIYLLAEWSQIVLTQCSGSESVALHCIATLSLSDLQGSQHSMKDERCLPTSLFLGTVFFSTLMPCALLTK